MNLNVKRALIVGFANLIVGFLLNFVAGLLFPSIALEYQNTGVFRPWNDPLMVVSFAYTFILGFTLAYLWDRLGKIEPKEFAKLYFVIATIPGMFITYTSFNVSLGMVLLWSFSGFVQAFIAGSVFAKVKK